MGKENENEENETGIKEKDNELLKKILGHPVVSAVLAAAILGGVAAVWDFTISYRETKRDIARILEDVSEIRDIDDGLEDLEGKVTDMEEKLSELDSKIISIGGRVSELEEMAQESVNAYGEIVFLKGISESIQLEKRSSTEYELRNPTWRFEQTIAIDERSGEEYSAGELANRRISLSYSDNGIDTIFLGQFNENNNWDGDCLINSYTDGSLSLVMEASYDDGQLLSYRQIIPYVTSQGEDAWIVSDREVKGDYNSGNSWSYYRTGDKEISFQLDNISEDDLITIDNFSEIDINRLEGFYHGNTSGGYYNDDTGQAYLIKYGKNGTVRTLYMGNMKDGECEDKTGNAWSISRDEELDEYVYYIGAFEGNGKIYKDAKHNPVVTVDEIKEIIKDYSFECEMRWAGQNI